MIKRITKETAQLHMGQQMHDDNYPLEILVAGAGRYFMIDPTTTQDERQKFFEEWRDSKGAELPSYKLEESIE